jgi:hypothetical protein
MTESYTWTTATNRVTGAANNTIPGRIPIVARLPVTPINDVEIDATDFRARMRPLLPPERTFEMDWKDYIDNLITQTGGLSESEKAFARADQKIAGIKEIRARTGIGLKEAKDLIEHYMGNPELLEPRKRFKDEIDKILEF